MSLENKLFSFATEFVTNPSLQAKETAKQAILNDLLELIGEDETTERNGLIGVTHKDENRNFLRQELRDKVRKYCE